MLTLANKNELSRQMTQTYIKNGQEACRGILVVRVGILRIVEDNPMCLTIQVEKLYNITHF
jgi:hypothetical protein